MRLRLEGILNHTSQLEAELHRFVVGDAAIGYSIHQVADQKISSADKLKEHLKMYPLRLDFREGVVNVNLNYITERYFFGLLSRKTLKCRVQAFANGDEAQVDEFIMFYDRIFGKDNYKKTVLG